ncbi:hypothetical protein C6T65_16640 [Burkholderia vietnamiensis]|uniref:Uncharacterized protein n=1 Tax=Burkholderia vietnamiensis TaxID=60552 RepID=A0AA44Y0H9_BURVI|nr:hypothetical protein C6T65_16640 [Burkholderia vietnamiensis]
MSERQGRPENGKIPRIVMEAAGAAGAVGAGRRLRASGRTAAARACRGAWPGRCGRRDGGGNADFTSARCRFPRARV